MAAFNIIDVSALGDAAMESALSCCSEIGKRMRTECASNEISEHHGRRERDTYHAKTGY